MEDDSDVRGTSPTARRIAQMPEGDPIRESAGTKGDAEYPRCTRLRRNAFESFYGTFGSPGRTRKEPPGRTASSMEAREVGIRNPYRQSYTVGVTWQTQYQAYTLTSDVPKLGTHLHLSEVRKVV
ncbi:hypothetical protein Bbelb_242520 [Branchiostoma belcheri]|nr:hypothetical protein Bbelb_242520 [Branchiostoma belcheri]